MPPAPRTVSAVPVTMPSTTNRSKVLLAKRPIASAGPHDEEVDRLVEVPLVEAEQVDRAQALAEARRQLRPRDPERSQAMPMPSSEIAPPIASPRHSAPTLGWIALSGESAKTGSRKLEEDVVDAGDLDQAGEQGAEAEHRHRHRHRPRLLGDVVVGAGEADLGVLHLFGRRVDRRPVVELAGVDQVLGLLAGLARQHPEDQPEGVDRGEEGADVAADRHPRVHPAARLGVGEDRVLGEEARGEREGGQRQAADHEHRSR